MKPLNTNIGSIIFYYTFPRT